ncbi:Nit-4-like protein [Fusarium sp. NRRL 25303]|nr:Nit-4-like protein [Fusarium sp. NRRL 25303]
MDPQEARRLVPILPAQQTSGYIYGEDHSPGPSSPPHRLRKRVLVAVACEGCRRKKAKVRGFSLLEEGRCFSKSEACSYETPSVPVAVQKKYDILLVENQQYRELFDAINNKPECEAQEIFNRLRSSDQPLAVLESMRQAEVLLPKPSTNTWGSDPRLAFFDQKALESSVIQVPAKPWTTVAGDGIVSELITDFFTWDNSYMFPVLDRITFVDEMRAGDDTEVKWCSPLLVNAICAKRCLMVERGKQFGIMTGCNLSEVFLAEAKSHFESEQGRISIPTVQGLLLIYLTMTAMGKDRAGLIYRLTAYEMLKQLRLEARYKAAKNNVPPQTHDMMLTSKTLWGIFLLERPSTIPPPQVPKPFLSILTFTHKGNLDVLDRPWKDSSDLVPRPPGVLAAACSFSELLYEIMQYLTTSKVRRGGDGDIHTRRLFFSRLIQLKHDIPRQLVVEQNLTPVTCFLRIDENLILYTLLQDLPPDIPFGVPYSSTVKGLCIQHCRHDTEILGSFIKKWPTNLMIAHQLYISMQTLVPILDDTAAQDLFTKSCRMAQLSSGSVRLSGVLLQATQAFVWAMDKSIPGPARQHLEGWTQETTEKDLPMSFALPPRREVNEVLASDESDQECSIWNLGTLIEKWAMLSMAGSRLSS